MASPTPPTLSGLVSEAFYQAGESNPSTALTTRGQTIWPEEIKADIAKISKKLKSLETRGLQVLTNGLPEYANPSDFACDLALLYATGTRYGACQAGSSLFIQVAAASTFNEADVIGKEVAIVSGSGLGAVSYVTAYNSISKVLTVSPAFSPVPVSGDTYVILDFYKEVEEKPYFRFSSLALPNRLGEPECFYPFGDSSNGKIILAPTPYRTDSQPQVLVQRYYADLMELDLAGTLMATLYQKWRPVWMTGLIWKALEDGDDGRAQQQEREYREELRKLVASEGFVNQSNILQIQVLDYP